MRTRALTMARHFLKQPYAARARLRGQRARRIRACRNYTQRFYHFRSQRTGPAARTVGSAALCAPMPPNAHTLHTFTARTHTPYHYYHRHGVGQLYNSKTRATHCTARLQHDDIPPLYNVTDAHLYHGKTTACCRAHAALPTFAALRCARAPAVYRARAPKLLPQNIRGNNLPPSPNPSPVTTFIPFYPAASVALSTSAYQCVETNYRACYLPTNFVRSSALFPTYLLLVRSCMFWIRLPLLAVHYFLPQQHSGGFLLCGLTWLPLRARALYLPPHTCRAPRRAPFYHADAQRATRCYAFAPCRTLACARRGMRPLCNCVADAGAPRVRAALAFFALRLSRATYAVCVYAVTKRTSAQRRARRYRALARRDVAYISPASISRGLFNLFRAISRALLPPTFRPYLHLPVLQAP